MSTQDWKQYARTVAEQLRFAERTVQTLAAFRMSGGSSLAMGLSAMSVASTVIDTFVPQPDISEYLRKNLGYVITPWSSFFDRMVIVWLRTHPNTKMIEHRKWRAATFLEYPEFGLGILLGQSGAPTTPGGGAGDSALSAGTLHVKPSDASESQLARLVDECFWKGGDQEVTLKHENNEANAHFRPLPEPVPDYIGDPTAESIVADLPAGKAHTIFLWGPSGGGKSSLARQIARKVNPTGRMLRFSTRSFGIWDLSTLRQMLSLLKPNVLLVDDLQSYLGSTHIDTLIELLEGVNQVVSDGGGLLLGTIMTEADTIPSKEGLRPGRVDRWVRVRRPTSERRRTILSLYLKGEPPPHMVECTDGLTGAYLKHIAERYQVRPELWRHALAEMRLSLRKDEDLTARMFKATSASSRKDFEDLRSRVLKGEAVRLSGPPSPQELELRGIAGLNQVRTLVEGTFQDFVTDGVIDTATLRVMVGAVLDETNVVVEQAAGQADAGIPEPTKMTDEVRTLLEGRGAAAEQATGTQIRKMRFEDRHLDVTMKYVIGQVLGVGWETDNDALRLLR